MRVTSSSGFILRKVFYTVPSRLIGYRLNLRIYDDRLECFVGQSLVLSLPPAPCAQRWPPHPGGGLSAYYSQLALQADGATASCLPRRAVPTAGLRRAAWERLIDACDARVACRTMVELLALAHERSCEADLAAALTQQLLEGGKARLWQYVRARSRPEHQLACPVVAVSLPSIASYDVLLPAMAATAGAATP